MNITLYLLTSMTYKISDYPFRESIGLFLSISSANKAKEANLKYGYYNYEIIPIEVTKKEYNDKKRLICYKYE